jgi:CheY-like chemotaxis protein
MALVLVVDDDAQLRATLVHILSTARHEVIDVGNGSAGLEMVRSRKPDVVITDIIMPEKEGIEVILHVRKMMPDVKIIAISGGGRIGQHQFLPVAKKLGADIALCKPIRAAELLAAVSGLLKDRPEAAGTASE